MAFYKARYDFEIENDDELPLEKGDFLFVEGDEQSEWFSGYSLRLQRHGAFPVNYVDAVDVKIVSRRAKFDFDAESATELSLRKGDTIIDIPFEIATGGDEWAKGINTRTFEVGEFPKNYTEVAQEGRTSTPNGTSLAKTFRVEYDFAPQEADEIRAQEGDMVVEIQDSTDAGEGWLKVRHHRTKKVGMIPKSYCSPWNGSADEADAAVKIQAAMRGRQSRKQAREMEQKAVKIQAAMRGRQSRKQVNEMKKHTKKTLVKASAPRPSPIVKNANKESMSSVDVNLLVSQLTETLTAKMNSEMDKRDQVIRDLRHQMEHMAQSQRSLNVSPIKARRHLVPARRTVNADGDALSDYCLQFVVSSANGLKETDIIGQCDPYVVIKLNGEKCGQTGTLPGTSDPSWEETFTVKPRAFSRELKGTTLTFEVWDHDYVGEHDFLGQVLLTGNVLTQFVSSKTPCSFPLKTKNGTRMVEKGMLWVSFKSLTEDGQRRRASSRNTARSTNTSSREYLDDLPQPPRYRSKRKHLRPGARKYREVEHEDLLSHKTNVRRSLKFTNSTKALTANELRLLRDQYYNGHSSAKRSNRHLKLEDIQDPVTKQAIAKVKAFAAIPAKGGRFDLKGFQGEALDANELRRQFRFLHVKISFEEAEALVDLWDTDGSKRVDYTEFLYNFHKWRREGQSVDAQSLAADRIYFPSIGSGSQTPRKIRSDESHDRNRGTGLADFREYRERSRNSIKCPICGTTGHFASECTMGSVQSRERERVQQQRVIRARYDRTKMESLRAPKRPSPPQHKAQFGGRPPISERERIRRKRQRDKYSINGKFKAGRPY